MPAVRILHPAVNTEVLTSAYGSCIVFAITLTVKEVIFMQKTKKAYPLAVLVAAALLTALSIVLGKYLAIRVGDTLRFSFENLPILLAGMAFGPAVGVLTAVAADLIGCLMVGYAINPVITVGGALIGVLGGLLYRLLGKLPLGVRVTFATFIAHLVGSVVIKTFGLSAFYDLPLWELALWRLLNYAVVGGAETALLYVIFKSKAIRSQLDAIRR